jgi:hypothetical protein
MKLPHVVYRNFGWKRELFNLIERDLKNSFVIYRYKSPVTVQEKESKKRIFFEEILRQTYRLIVIPIDRK